MSKSVGTPNLYDLTVDTPDGKQTIHTTSNHLIWDVTTRTWVEASELRSGDRLLAADGMIVTADGGSTPLSHTGWMWDLTVDTLHTFYVVAGDTPVLVHNSSCGPGFSVSSDGTVTNLADPSATRVGVPTLEGGTLQQVGAKIWGNGDPTALIGTRTPEELRGIASLSDAEKLQDFYRSAELAGRGGTTAPARVVLTQEIIDAWSGG